MHMQIIKNLIFKQDLKYEISEKESICNFLPKPWTSIKCHKILKKVMLAHFTLEI